MATYVVNWAGVDDADGVVLTVDANPGAATDAAQGGVTLSKDLAMYCSASTPGTWDHFNAGMAVSPAGALRVLMCATADGPPADVQWVGGIPVSAAGAMCLTNDGTVDHYVKGWPVDAGGLVISDTDITVGHLLLEGGGFLLLQGGGKIILES